MTKFDDRKCKRCETVFSPNTARTEYCPSCRLHCAVDGCAQKPYIGGHCTTHHSRLRKYGTVGAAERIRHPQGETCSVEGCSRKPDSLQLCSMHVRRFRATGDVGRPDKLLKSTDGPCSVIGCKRAVLADDLCNMHYLRKSNGKSLGGPDPQRRDRGEGHINRDGYKKIVVDGVPILEHRAVMEKILGRKLRPEETVHHKNGQRTFNDPSNLELWSSRQPSGQRVEDKVAWAIELLQLYPEYLNAHCFELRSTAGDLQQRLEEDFQRNGGSLSQAISGLAGLI